MNTYIFQVETPRMGGGQPSVDYYLVAATHQHEALKALQPVIDSPSQQVKEFRELQPGLAEFMGMRDGQVMLWSSVS